MCFSPSDDDGKSNGSELEDEISASQLSSIEAPKRVTADELRTRIEDMQTMQDDMAQMLVELMGVLDSQGAEQERAMTPAQQATFASCVVEFQKVHDQIIQAQQQVIRQLQSHNMDYYPCEAD